MTDNEPKTFREKLAAIPAADLADYEKLYILAMDELKERAAEYIRAEVAKQDRILLDGIK